VFSYIVRFVHCLLFNTCVNVYFQGNRKRSFLSGCACLCIDLLISCALKLNDDDDDDDDLCEESATIDCDCDILLMFQRCLTMLKLIMSVTAMIMTAASAASGI